uniref:Glutamate rich 4 n=1 Tax=Pipistrellus kuhlii TaxID=59472 RepID=A0A7J7SNB0_PIPKU|nr:glutamate rich 4 [Pipistrellus kuhlii]
MRENHRPAASCTLPTGDVPATKENLRRVDVQLLGQLCSLGLEMGLLREELVAFLEEEEEIFEEEEEDEEPEGKQEEVHLGVSCPASGHRLPDFEMTI